MKTQKLIGTVLTAVMLSGGGLAVAKNIANKKNVNNLQQQAWLLSNPNADPTEPGNYQAYTGNLNDACEQDEAVCGIMAPGTSTPAIDQVSGLAEDLEQESDHPNIAFGPRAN